MVLGALVGTSEGNEMVLGKGNVDVGGERTRLMGGEGDLTINSGVEVVTNVVHGVKVLLG